MAKCSLCEYEMDDPDWGEYHIKNKGKKFMCRDCEKRVAQSVVNSY